MEEAEVGCCVCQERYGDEERSPRNLGCGHSVCTSCVRELITRNRKCPECRRPFYAASATSLPVNYPLLRLSRTLAAMNLQGMQQQQNQHFEGGGRVRGSPSRNALGSITDAGECLAHDSRLTLRCMRCRVWVCKQCLQVDHATPPNGECRALPVRQALEEMKKIHTKDVSTMCTTLQGLKNDLAGQMANLNDNKTHHNDIVSSFQPLLQGELNIIQELEIKKKEATDKMTEIDSWIRSLREAETSILRARTVRELATAQLASRDCVTGVETRVLQERQRQAVCLRTMPQLRLQNLRGLLQVAKEMYAEKREEEEEEEETCGGRRGGGRQSQGWARLSLHDCLLHLHVYQHRPNAPPANALVFSYSSVRELVPTESPSAFFDLAWGGKTQGRVYLRMLGSTQRGQQFLLLCSGEKGPSYLQTRLFQADRVGELGEIIRGGDYEHNDGTGGTPLVEGLANGGDYLREAEEGLLVGAHANQIERLAVFGIILSAWPGRQTDTAFGIVTSGLGTLRSAARHDPITDVAVENCGLVIPL